jgi:hypothetical protein
MASCASEDLPRLPSLPFLERMARDSFSVHTHAELMQVRMLPPHSQMVRKLCYCTVSVKFRYVGPAPP